MTFRQLLARLELREVRRRIAKAEAKICGPLPKKKRTREALEGMLALAALMLTRAEESSRGAWRRWMEVR